VLEDEGPDVVALEDLFLETLDKESSPASAFVYFVLGTSRL
jgi:hypothetical protein